MSESRENQQKTDHRNVFLFILAVSLMVLVWSCGATDSRPAAPWERAESSWRFEALLNGEPIEGEIDTSWNHPRTGFSFRLHLSTPEDWPYIAQLSIRPAIHTIPLDTMLKLNNKDRMEHFEQLSSHSFIYELDHDAVLTDYRLNLEEGANFISFTRLEEEEVEGRYRAVAEGVFEATYIIESVPTAQWVQEFRRLPDTVRITNGRFETVLLEWDDYEYWKEQY